MPYIDLADFRFGMDRRRKRAAGIAGSLWTLRDAHLTRGGDIERRKKFVPTYILPEGTFSMGAVRGRLFTFGSDDLSGDVPVGVEFQRLEASGSDMVKILDAKPFAGLMYAIAEFASGHIYHYYNGSRVTSWDTAVTPSAPRVAERLAGKLSGNETVDAVAFGAAITVTARTAGVGFIILVDETDGGVDSSEDIDVTQVQANIEEVDEERGFAAFTIIDGSSDPGTNIISAVTIDGDPLTAAAVDWTGSHTSTATAVANAINNLTSTHGYTASTAGPIVTLTAGAGTGAAVNGLALEVVVGGNVAVTADAAVVGGVTAIAAVKQVERVTITGLIENNDVFTVHIDDEVYKATGLSAEMGTSLFIGEQRVWSPAGSAWRFCKLADPTQWDPAVVGSDAGFIDVSSDTEGNDNLAAAVRYQEQAAVFSQSNVTFYAIDVDPDLNAFVTSAENTGTSAPRSITRYGNNDVFYLDPSGIRSLQALNASNAPFVSDVGSAIDSFVQTALATLTRLEVRDAVSAIEPADNRFWLAAGGFIFVFTNFASTGIKAWSYYEPGWTADSFARLRDRLYVRSGDTIYLYGGEFGDEYDDDETGLPLVEIPFLGANSPATFKEFTAFDITCTGTWSIDVLYDPNNEERTINAGVYDKITFNEVKPALSGETSKVGLKLTCQSAGAASVSAMQIHYAVHEGPRS